MTNADHIRAMTDEEIVEFLLPLNCPPVPPGGHCWDTRLDCEVCWREWLKLPYEEDNE